MQVNWTAPADNGAPILGYRLYMAEEQAPAKLVYDGSNSSRSDVLTYTVYEGVTRGLDYQFVVQALNAVGDSDRSDPLAILAAVVPSAPLNLNVTGSGSGSVSLEWTAPEKVGGSVLLGYYAYYQLYSALLTAPDV